MELTLCLTHDCNLRCRYCYAGRKYARAMSWEIARAAIDFGVKESLREARGSGRDAVLTLGFFGGEPLLEWDLLLRCDSYARQMAAEASVVLRATLTTNLTLLDAAKCSMLLERDYWLGLSMDGNAAMHDALRRYADGGPTHADCARALALMKGHEERGEIICVIDPANVRHLENGVRWLVEHTRLPIALNPNFSARWAERALAELHRQYERVGDYYAACYRKGVPFSLNVIDGKIIAHIQGGYQACDRCGMGEGEVAVAPSGRFYPCARLVGNDDRDDLVVGDALNGFDAARRLAMIARRGNRHPACIPCPLRPRCMNWCGCVNYVASGDIGTVAPLTCAHEKLCIAVADRVASALWEERNEAFLMRFYGMMARPNASSA